MDPKACCTGSTLEWHLTAVHTRQGSYTNLHVNDLKTLFACLCEDTDWGLHAVSLAVRLSASVGTHQLEGTGKKQFFRSIVSAMVESTAPEAHTAHVKAALEAVLGSTSSLPMWAQVFLDSPVATAKTPQALAASQGPYRPSTPREYPVFLPSAPMPRIHLSNAQGADWDDIVRALKLLFGDSVDVGFEVVSKGFWCLEVCELAWQHFV